MLFACRNIQEPMAMTEIGIGKSALLRTEQQSNTAAGRAAQMFADHRRPGIQGVKRMLEFTMTPGGGPNDKSAIGDSAGNRLMFLRVGEKFRRANSRTRFAKRQIIWIDHAQIAEAEIAHGARRRANIERIARGYQDHAQAVEFRWKRQDQLF